MKKEPLVVGCPHCGTVQMVPQVSWKEVACCVSCQGHLTPLNPWALPSCSLLFTLLATCCYFPGITLPVVHTETLGTLRKTSILEKMLVLFNQGDYLLGLCILLFSLIVPQLKLMLMFVSIVSAYLLPDWSARWRPLFYTVTEFIGRWGMADVFLVTILVVLMQVKGMMTVVPGEGLWFFSGYVLYSLLASAFFDPRRIEHHARAAAQSSNADIGH
ncbi:MAG: paraquat-inducible protein A [Planctomycetaceae bacterium]|nr:MAG: paraquat-inducible protein A [Planctomycetaceae bacterium]